MGILLPVDTLASCSGVARFTLIWKNKIWGVGGITVFFRQQPGL